MVLFEQSSVVKELTTLTYDMWSKGWDEYNGGNVSCILSDGDLEQLPRDEPIKQVIVEDIPFDMVGKYILITASGSHFRNLRDHIKRDMGVIRVTEKGYDIVWGFSENRRPPARACAGYRPHRLGQIHHAVRHLGGRRRRHEENHHR